MRAVQYKWASQPILLRAFIQRKITYVPQMPLIGRYAPHSRGGYLLCDSGVKCCQWVADNKSRYSDTKLHLWINVWVAGKTV